MLDERTRAGKETVIRVGEMNEILSACKETSFRAHDMPWLAWQCLFSIFFMFGKRVSEVIELRTSNIFFDEEYVNITFSLRKKRKGAAPEDVVVTRRVSREHVYAPTVEKWHAIQLVNGREFMFPAPGTKTGHIYAQYLHTYIHNKLFLRGKIWTHLFRSSLATDIANAGISAWSLKAFMDWENIKTADSYVQRSHITTQPISDRTRQ